MVFSKVTVQHRPRLNFYEQTGAFIEGCIACDWDATRPYEREDQKVWEEFLAHIEDLPLKTLCPYCMSDTGGKYYKGSCPKCPKGQSLRRKK